MFQEVLKEFVDRTEGGVASVLMGYDGIPIDQYARDDADFNVESIGMEYGVLLAQIRQAAEMLELGDTREVAIQAERMTTVIRLLSKDYFVAMTVKPDGNVGKARYLLRVGAHRLLDALE